MEGHTAVTAALELSDVRSTSSGTSCYVSNTPISQIAEAVDKGIPLNLLRHWEEATPVRLRDGILTEVGNQLSPWA